MLKNPPPAYWIWTIKTLVRLSQPQSYQMCPQMSLSCFTWTQKVCQCFYCLPTLKTGRKKGCREETPRDWAALCGAPWRCSSSAHPCLRLLYFHHSLLIIQTSWILLERQILKTDLVDFNQKRGGVNASILSNYTQRMFFEPPHVYMKEIPSFVLCGSQWGFDSVFISRDLLYFLLNYRSCTSD